MQALLHAGVRFSKVSSSFPAAHIMSLGLALLASLSSAFFPAAGVGWLVVGLSGKIFGKRFLSLFCALNQLVPEVCMHFDELKSTTLNSLLFHQGLFSCGLEPSDFFVGIMCGCTSVLFRKFIYKCSISLKVTFSV